MSNPKKSVDEYAMGKIDSTDGDVLHRIAALYSQLDPVPDSLVDRVQFGLTLDALHAEIADLQRSADLVGVRSEGAPDVQTVTFTSANLTTMVTITVLSSERVRVDGWVVPGDGVAIELRQVGDALKTVSDADGRFVFESVPRGLAQFVLRTDSTTVEATVVTPSIEL